MCLVMKVCISRWRVMYPSLASICTGGPLVVRLVVAPWMGRSNSRMAAAAAPALASLVLADCAPLVDVAVVGEADLARPGPVADRRVVRAPFVPPPPVVLLLRWKWTI